MTNTPPWSAAPLGVGSLLGAGMLLGGCTDLLGDLAAKGHDTGQCELIVVVDPESCTCATGVEWLVIDAAGAEFLSTGADGAAGPQVVGAPAHLDLSPGDFSIDATWYYVGDLTSSASGTGNCAGGAESTYTLTCDCGDLGA